MTTSTLPTTAITKAEAARARRWSVAALGAQAGFVASWLVAPRWQGPRYRPLAQSISDMYALTAPHGAVLVVIFTVCGALTVGFSARAVRQALRPGGWRAGLGASLLGLSIFGVGDLLSPFERLACRMADHGCTAAMQSSNGGGMRDDVLSTIGVPLFIAAGLFLASAMRRTPGWQRWAKPLRWAMALAVAAYLADGLVGGPTGLGGLFERLIAATGAVSIGALALGIYRKSPAGLAL